MLDKGRGQGLMASRLFDTMAATDREAVLALATTRRLARRQVLLRQGEPAAALFLIVSGYLKLTQVTADGEEIIVRFAGPSEPVGGVAALGGTAYPVTATATDASEVVGWPRAVLSEILGHHPAIKTNLMRELNAHMDDAMTRVREMTTERVGQRLARTLLRLARPAGSTGEAPIAIPHSLTRQELAALTGTTLFTVSRILTDWEEAGIVRSARARVEISDRTALRHLTEESDPRR